MKFINTKTLGHYQKLGFEQNFRYHIADLNYPLGTREAFAERKPRKDSKYMKDDSRYFIWDTKEKFRIN